MTAAAVERGAALPLVIGVGNPLRGDDGVGAAVAARLAGDHRLAGARVVVAHQLTPELAVDVAGASVVVVVDAAVGGQPGSVRAEPVAPGGSWSGSHRLTPGALVALAGVVSDSVPPVYTVAVGAATFAGRRLSAPVEGALDDARDAVARLVAGRRSVPASAEP